ncbi:MAG: response regulator [Candidatus Pristimantibacillus sp.]
MNILIVDDEAQIRRWFEALVIRTELPVTIAGTCGNGKEALEFCRSHAVDLVITDVKMPIMDGLELIRRLREEQPAIQTLILSSYDEFHYATEAMKLRAISYLLKAEVTVDELREAIQKVKLQWDVERNRSEEVYLLKSTINENQNVLKSIYFKDLIKGAPAAIQEFSSKMSWFRLHLDAKNLMVMAVGLDDYPNCLSYAKIGTQSLLELAMINIIDETIQNETGNGCSFLYDENLFIVLYNTNGSRGKSSRDESIQYAHRISNNLLDFLRVPASVGISQPYLDLSALPRQFSESREALQQKRFYGKRNIVWHPDLQLEQSKERREDWHSVVMDITYQVEEGDQERALQVLRIFLDNVRNSKQLSESSVRAFCLELIYVLLQKLRKIESQVDGHTRYDSATLLEQLARLSSFEELRQWLLSRVAGLLEEATELRPPYSESIRQAFRYLNTAYADEVSLLQVAEHVHLNKTYLSELFKKETGTSFNDHLTLIRIEKAKELILKGEEKMGVLAELVGYPNASYFTKVFKKITGMTPMEFKQKNGKS